MTPRLSNGRQVQSSEPSWSTICLHELPVATLELSEHGIILQANPAAEQLFGYTADELVGKPVTQLWDSPFCEVLHPFWHLAIRQGNAYFPCICRGKQGQRLVCGWELVAWRRSEGTRPSVLAWISQRELFAQLADHAPLGIALVNEEGHPVVVNAALCEMLGYTAEELARMPFTQFTHPEDAAADWQLFRELLSGQRKSYVMRKRYLRKDGQMVHALLSVCLLGGDRESPRLVLGMALDITREVLAEEQLRRHVEELRLFQKALESAGESVLITDANGVIQWVNPAFTRITGYTAEECVGQNPRLLKSGHHPPSFYASFWQQILSGQNWNGVFINRRKNGELYYDERTVAPILDETGRITHFVSVGEDVTERIKTELELQRSRDRLKCQTRILAAIAESASLDDLLPRLLEEAATLVGIDKGGLYLVEKDRVRMRVSKGLSPEFTRIVGEFPIHSPAYWLTEYRLVHEPLDQPGLTPDYAKREGIQSWAAIPLRLPSGQWLGTLMLGSTRPEAFKDLEATAISEISQHLALAIHHMQLRQELERTQTLLAQRERLHALGQMASGIAHDVNNSLVPVLALSEQLTRHADPSVRDLAQQMLQAAQDIAQLVRRLRVFYSQQPACDTLQAVDLNGLVQQCAEWTRPRWKDIAQQQGKTIELALDLAPNLPPIAGVLHEIREALVNLIFNAVDAILAKADSHGTITLRTRAETERAVVEVADTGIGMDEETCRRALEPFFTTKGPQGSGLGLPMVYGIVQRHGGQIEIHSAPGVGTTVRLVFPQRTPPRSEQATRTISPNSHLRILLADDDPRVRETLRLMLQTLGHCIVPAADGHQAVAQFQESLREGKHFDVVITDLGMPGMSGAEVTRWIKNISPQTPVIVLTGWGQDSKPTEADYGLSKPVLLADLQSALAEVCSRSPDRGRAVNGQVEYCL